MKRVGFIARSVTLGALLLGANLKANLFVNGSFEAEDYSSNPYGNVWNPGTGPTGWLQSGNQGVSIYNVGSANSSVFPLPQFGSQFYYVGQAGTQATVSQGIGLNSGQAYDLSFYFSPLTTGQDAFLDLTITDGSETFSPGLTYDYSQTGSGSPTWQLVTYSFTAGHAATYTFQFTSQGSGTAVVLDNVSLTMIPEPATTAAVIGALALGAMLVRRRYGAAV